MSRNVVPKKQPRDSAEKRSPLSFFPFKNRGKRQLLVHYCACGSNFLDMFLYVDGKLSETAHAELGTSQISEQALASRIREKFSDIDAIRLLISHPDVFKVTVNVPKVSAFKAVQIYNAEIKDELSQYGEKFRSFYECCSHSLGYIFYTYFVPAKTVALFYKAAMLLGAKLASFDLYERYVARIAAKRVKGDFLLIKQKYGVAHLILSYGKAFCAGSVFEYSREALERQLAIVVAKHAFELEKKEVTNLLVDSETDLGLQGAEAFVLPFDALDEKGERI